MHHLHDRHSSGVVTDAIMALKIAGLNQGWASQGLENSLSSNREPLLNQGRHKEQKERNRLRISSAVLCP